MSRVNVAMFQSYLDDHGFSTEEQNYLLKALEASARPWDFISYASSYGFNNERLDLVGQIFAHSLKDEK